MRRRRVPVSGLQSFPIRIFAAPACIGIWGNARIDVHQEETASAFGHAQFLNTGVSFGSVAS